MYIAQYEAMMLYYQERRREDQHWYAQQDREQTFDERQENILRRIKRRLHTAQQVRTAKAARHAHAM